MNDIKNCVEMLKNDISKKKVLDVGCGVGHFAKEAAILAKLVRAIDVEDYGTNFSEIKNISFKKMDARKITYKENNFDLVMFYNAMMYMENDFEDVLNEALRVVKENGAVALATTSSYERNLMYYTFPKRLDTMNLKYKVMKNYNLHIILIRQKQGDVENKEIEITH